MDLGGWLRSLGLERYEAAFRENEIDETVLRDLTEDHLRELGFPLGARLKLLKAIAALGMPAAPIGPLAHVAPAQSGHVPRYHLGPFLGEERKKTFASVSSALN